MRLQPYYQPAGLHELVSVFLGGPYTQPVVLQNISNISYLK